MQLQSPRISSLKFHADLPAILEFWFFKIGAWYLKKEKRKFIMFTV
jgi:hypothetical protein